MLGRAWRAPAVTSHVQPASVSRVVSIKTNRYQSHTHTHTFTASNASLSIVYAILDAYKYNITRCCFSLNFSFSTLILCIVTCSTVIYSSCRQLFNETTHTQ